MSNLTQFSQAIRTKGLAKASKFEVFIPLPTVLSEIGWEGSDAGFVQLMAEQAQLPEFALQTHTIVDDSIGRQVPHGKNYPPVSLTFICDSGMDTKKFFDEWILNSMKSPNGVFRYREAYAVDYIAVSQLNEAGVTTHRVLMFDAFPIVVDDIFYSASSHDYNRCRVQFAYTRWAIEILGQ